MRKLLIILPFSLILIFSSTIAINSNSRTTVRNQNDISCIKEKHQWFYKNSPFKETINLSKTERKTLGLPPNKYLEREWELTMDPELGRPRGENVLQIQKELEQNRLKTSALGRVPGDALDNNWVERGPNNIGGRTRAIMFDPNDSSNQTVFAGAVSGGLWKNTNISSQTSTWTPVNIPENLNISTITYDPNDFNTFYIGTGESYVGGAVNGNGVWKSTDAGTTWENVLGGITGDSYFQSASIITVNGPVDVANNYASVETTAFGVEITSAITADLVLANDQINGMPAEGCNEFGANVSGKIALIRRGSCSFTTKVKKAQDAGAIGVIVMNNILGIPSAMGGTDATINIPSLMISKTDGDILEASLNNGVTINVTLNPSSGDFTGVLSPGIQHINDIVVRDNAGVSEIYVAVGETFYADANTETYLGGPEFGLYKSIDGGENWNEIILTNTLGGNKYSPNDIELGADNTLWIGTKRSSLYKDGGGVILKSEDGINFSEKVSITNGRRVELASSRTNGDIIYVLAESRTLNASQNTIIAPYLTMFKTNDAFSSVTTMTLPNDIDPNINANDFTRGQAFYNLTIAVDPANDSNIFVGGIDLFKSTNGGQAWTQISHWYGLAGLDNVHADQHNIAFGHGDESKMIFGNDGGVYFSNNSGNTIVKRNAGYNVTQFYRVGVAPTTGGVGDTFAAGSQDNGTQHFSNSGPGIDGSFMSQGGDGAGTDFNRLGNSNQTKYYVSNYIYNNNINKRNYAGATLKSLNGGTNRGDFINQQDLDSNLNLLYTNYSDTNSNPRVYSIGRYIMTGNSTSPTVLTNTLLNSSPTAIKVSPFTTNSTKLFVGTFFSDLLMVTNANGTPTWTSIGGSDFIGSISDIEFGSTENDILVTMHNYGVKSVWYTSDGGITWNSKEGNLPDLPVKTILQNPLNTEQVILGTELGVWYTNNFSDNQPIWNSSFNGMSNVKVTDLVLRDDNSVYAATYGRGVFSGQFTEESFGVNLSPKVYLQGATLMPEAGEETLMRNNLRLGSYIPTTSPYQDALQCSSSVFNSGGTLGTGSNTDDIVDWVWVELRDASSNTTVISGQSALLQRDGDVVSVDGTSPLTFSQSAGDFYVAVKHRNHLGIITASTVNLSGTNTVVDFTDANNQITYGTNAQTSYGMPNGIIAMWAGDVNNDGQLNYLGAASDIPSIRSQVFNDSNNSVFGGPPVATYQSLGYTATDVNMDGVTIYSGNGSDVLFIRNNIFNNPSNSVFNGPPVGTFLFTQQLPEGANN